MKRQDVSGVERLAVEGTGGGVGTDVNLVDINGTPPSTGLGASDAGTLRVAISSDSPSTGNPAAGATGAAVPAQADYQGVNVAGNLEGVTGVNPSGSIIAEQVDLASIAGTTASVNNGATDAGTLRVTISSDSTGQVALAAGTAVIGHVITDSGSTTAVTGNVTVVQGTATNLKAQAEAYQGGSAVGAANPLQVSLANTGANGTAVKVDGTGGTFPISGTVAVTQSTSPWIVAGGGTAGTAATGVVTVQGIASMTPVQVSQATAASLNATVVQATGTNLHTVIDSGTITTVSAVTAISNALPAGTNLLGKVSASSETSTIYSGTTAVTPKFAAISASSNGNNTVVAAGTNKIRVLGWNLMASGTVNVKWQSGAGGTDLTGLYYLVANTGISVAYNPLGWFETASATLLNLNLSGATAVGGNLCYIDVA